MKRPSDLEELVHRLVAAGRGKGEDLAWLRRRLHAAATAALGPMDALRRVLDSEDLAQEALLTLSQHAHLFRGTTWAEFFAFAHAALRQRRVDLLRYHGRDRRRAPLGGADHDIEDAQAGPVTSIVHRDDIERVRTLLAELPSDLGRVARLRMDGHDYESIGLQLDITPTAARKRFSRALEELRRRWPDAPFDG